MSDNGHGSRSLPGRRPFGLEWRSSVWFSTLVVGVGLATDLLVYSIPIPVIPFQLQRLHYSDVSSLVGWLLFAFSGALVISTPTLAMLSEKHGARRWPLILGLVALIASQIMFMEAPTYWVMCVARFVQGFASSVVWIIGLALLCDVTPEKHIGRQLGLAGSGLTIGMLLGPPVSGALYGRFGFRGPYIFGIIVTVFDLIGRILIIERKDALLYGIDTTADTRDGDGEAQRDTTPSLPTDTSGSPTQSNAESSKDAYPEVVDAEQAEERAATEKRASAPVSQGPVDAPKHLSFVQVILTLGRSPRALVGMVNAFIYAIAFTSQEPTIPLHLQNLWGLNSTMVGVVMIGSFIPSAISGPLAGWYSDKKGPEMVVTLSILLALPWWIVIIIPGHLALFITAYAIQSFFTAAFMAPLMAELAAVSRELEGIGYAHIYGAFNLAYGIGSAIGPIVGGQLYDHVRHGWTAVCLVAAGSLCVAFVLAFWYCGPDPLFAQVRRRFSRGRAVEGESAVG